MGCLTGEPWRAGGIGFEGNGCVRKSSFFVAVTPLICDLTGYYVGFIIIGTITILFTVYHKQIVKALQPTANKLKE